VTTPTPTTVVFDLGGVLIDWDPRHLYRGLLDDPDEIEAFLDEVGFAAWNAGLDAGRPWLEAVEQLAAEHPHRRALIEAFHANWPETLAGEIPGMVELLGDLRDAGVRILALSNWSADTFPVALERFAFLHWFEGVVISGEVGVIKPDARMFEVLTERFAVDPADAVYIDDSPANVAAAANLGFHAIRFTSPDVVRAEVVALGLLPER
jgi:2-haloacid dehalogenase